MSDLVMGEFRGYRAWRLHGLDSDRLRALSTDHPWGAGTVDATCHATWLPEQKPHPAPFTGCTCGLYAYYRATTVPERPGTVFGVVGVQGKVILATRGMKAERMEILALATDDVALGERYGVPIYPSREALLSDYPPQDYGELVDVDPTDPADWGSVTFTMTVDLTRFGVAMARAAESMQKAMAQVTASTPDWAAFTDGIPTPSDHSADDVMARALELRKTRNTGPKADPFRWTRRRR